MELRWLPGLYAVCRLPASGGMPPPGGFVSLTVTDSEVSLVCPSERVPADAEAVEDGWRAFAVAGTLDFSLIGVLAGITGTLAAAGVSVFAVSTYNTDYVLVRGGDAARAAAALNGAEYSGLYPPRPTTS